MNLNLISHPCTWYTDKLDRREPFTLLMYGDGEWLVALRERTGRRMAYSEVITPGLEQEMRDALHLRDPAVLRATDFNLLNVELDWARPLALRVRRLLEECKAVPDWYDGVIWDNAAREAGSLNPLLKALWKRDVVLIGQPCLREAPGLRCSSFVAVPQYNAAASLDDIERACIHACRTGFSDDPVLLLCMGLGGSPLAMRLHKRMPQATFMDLGSALDVLVKASGDRAWRKIMYADEAVWRETVRKHTEGVGS